MEGGSDGVTSESNRTAFGVRGVVIKRGWGQAITSLREGFRDLSPRAFPEGYQGRGGVSPVGYAGALGHLHADLGRVLLEVVPYGLGGAYESLPLLLVAVPLVHDAVGQVHDTLPYCLALGGDLKY